MNFSNYRNQYKLLTEQSNLGNVSSRTVGYCQHIPFNIGDLQTISKMLQLSEETKTQCELVLIGDISDPYTNALSCKLNETLPDVRISVFQSVSEHMIALNDGNKSPTDVVGGADTINESKRVASIIFSETPPRYTITASDVIDLRCKEAVSADDEIEFASYLTEYDDGHLFDVFQIVKESYNG